MASTGSPSGAVRSSAVATARSRTLDDLGAGEALAAPVCTSGSARTSSRSAALLRWRASCAVSRRRFSLADRDHPALAGPGLQHLRRAAAAAPARRLGVSAISICPGSKRTGRTQRSSANGEHDVALGPRAWRSRPRSCEASAGTFDGAAAARRAAAGAAPPGARAAGAPAPARAGARRRRRSGDRRRRRRLPASMRIASSGVGRSAAWQRRTSTMSAAASGRGACATSSMPFSSICQARDSTRDATASRRRRRRAPAPSRRRPPGSAAFGASFSRVT